MAWPTASSNVAWNRESNPLCPESSGEFFWSGSKWLTPAGPLLASHYSRYCSIAGQASTVLGGPCSDIEGSDLSVQLLALAYAVNVAARSPYQQNRGEPGRYARARQSRAKRILRRERVRR